MKKFLGVLIFTTFLSSAFQVINIGGISITLFRLCFLLFTSLHTISIFKKISANNWKISIDPDMKLYRILLITFCMCVLCTSIWIGEIPLSLWISGAITLCINLLLIYYVYYYTEDIRDLEVFLEAFILGLLLTIIVSIYEYLTGNHIAPNYIQEFSSYSWEYEVLSKAPTAFLFNPNNVGVIVVLGIPLSGFIQIRFKSKIVGKLAKYSFILFSMFVIFATGSRGCMLLSIVILVLDYLSNKINLIKKIFYLLVMSITIIIIVNFSKDFILGQLNYAGFFDSGSFSILSSGDTARFDLIKNGMESTVKTYFIGGGPSSSEILIGKVTGTPFSVHMFWLETLINYGIVGFSCMVIFYVKCLNTMAVLKNKSEFARYIMIMLITFIFISVIPPTIYTLNCIWIIFGFSLALEKINKNTI